jgi:hypothetical protein
MSIKYWLNYYNPRGWRPGEKALNRTDEVKQKYRLASSKSVIAYNKDSTVFIKFTGI